MRGRRGKGGGDRQIVLQKEYKDNEKERKEEPGRRRGRFGNCYTNYEIQCGRQEERGRVREKVKRRNEEDKERDRHRHN